MEEITEIKKSAKRVIFRIMAGLLIFFIPGIINYIFSLIDVNESDCLKCMLNTSTCSTIKKASDSSIINNSECNIENENSICISNAIFNES